MILPTFSRRLARLRPLVLIAATALGCAGEGETPPVAPPEPTTLAIGTPAIGTLKQGRRDDYRVAVTRGASYVVSLTSLTDSALGLLVGNAEAAPISVQTVAAPKDVTLQAAGTSLLISVDAAALIKPTGSYVVTVTQAPSVPTIDVSPEIPARTPTVGWVPTRGTSRYHTAGLGAGTHTVSIVGLTADAQLHVYPDATYTLELDCTLRHPEARECVVAGPDAYYSVTAGPLNRDGAGYVILVW